MTKTPFTTTRAIRRDVLLLELLEPSVALSCEEPDIFLFAGGLDDAAAEVE